jgi:hypothetical protein
VEGRDGMPARTRKKGSPTTSDDDKVGACHFSPIPSLVLDTMGDVKLTIEARS